MHLIKILALWIGMLSPLYANGPELTLFWWQPLDDSENFGDYLSKVIVERLLKHPVVKKPLDHPHKLLMAAGSILHFARNGDVVWGSGFREDPSLENNFTNLDVRAVRGPKTRQFLLQKGVACPEVYGDPAILMAYLFPKFKKQLNPRYDYIIIPNRGEVDLFSAYKNVVLPTSPWEEIIEKILDSRLVISGSLHGIIVAEAFGVPARLLKISWQENLLKYEDYYESTNRPYFRYALSVQNALEMGGEPPGQLDLKPLLAAFPWDYFHTQLRR